MHRSIRGGLIFWILAFGMSDRIPEEKVRKKIKAPAYERMTKTAEQLLEGEEVRAMIEAAKTSRRDRALISVLYKSGCRIGEIARAQVV